MKIETTFSCGDRAWVCRDGEVRQLTIGQVRVEITDSAGVDQEGIKFDNYAACKGYREQYMCVETGIGSGSLYEIGVCIFASKDECESANAERIAERAAENLENERRNRERLLNQESELRSRLAWIEAIKSSGGAA